jgi:primosomal protein N' (replication factor Y) (superfamily II helicase)
MLIFEYQMIWDGDSESCRISPARIWCKNLIVESEKANSSNKIKNILLELNQSPILIWTSLLSTAIPEYPLDLVVFLNADIGLNIPDYNVGEKNFNLLYHTFLNHHHAQFIVQTFNPGHYSIRSACALDEQGFWEQENIFRKEHNYPPFADLCVLLYKNEIEDKVFSKVDKLHKELLYLKERYQLHDLEIYATPPLIYKIFGKYRYNIILKWPNLFPKIR